MNSGAVQMERCQLTGEHGKVVAVAKDVQPPVGMSFLYPAPCLQQQVEAFLIGETAHGYDAVRISLRAGTLRGIEGQRIGQAHHPGHQLLPAPGIIGRERRQRIEAAHGMPQCTIAPSGNHTAERADGLVLIVNMVYHARMGLDHESLSSVRHEQGLLLMGILVGADHHIGLMHGQKAAQGQQQLATELPPTERPQQHRGLIGGIETDVKVDAVHLG